MKDRLAWEDMRVLLAVSDQGSFRAAAGPLRLSINTIRKRIDRLERSHGATLLRRSSEGTTLTAAGASLVDAARQMRSLAGLQAGSDPNILVNPGEVRIGCSEAIGSIWLLPRVMDLQTRLGGLTVSLQCDYDLERDRMKSLDIGLQLIRPTSPDLICSRVATLHFMLYASRDYIRENGTPQTLDDVRRFRMVEHVSPGVRSDFIDALIGADRPPDFVPLRTNSSIGIFWAVANGTGIGALPTYVCEVSSSVVPLDLPARLRRELFLVYHSESRGSPAIKETIAWLRRCFDPARHPWFADEFVHPRERGGPDREVS